AVKGPELKNWRCTSLRISMHPVRSAKESGSTRKCSRSVIAGRPSRRCCPYPWTKRFRSSLVLRNSRSDSICSPPSGWAICASATTLSRGEAQRLKVAAELKNSSAKDMLYIMDEPTTGLHFDDVKKLLAVLHKLVNAGNTLVVVEHNLDVIKSADWVIDLGPEGGAAGGRIVAEGRPEQVAKVEASHTGRFLAHALNELSHHREPVLQP